MSVMGHYRHFPYGWEYEPSDSSVGILSEGMTHIVCLDRENAGSADLTGGRPTGFRLSGGYERFTEEWTCRDCGRMRTFTVDDYTGWDQPAEGDDPDVR